MFERLSNVHQWQTLFTGSQGSGHPSNDHISPTASNNLLRRNIGPTGKDCHIQTFVGVIALGCGYIIAGELSLRHPFQLQLHRIIGKCSACGHSKSCRRDQKFLHCVDLHVKSPPPL